MKISLITTCFNREATIGQAIESVLVQDYPDVEYIVVDGASRDHSLSVIGQYRDHIDRLISEPDHGMYEAINKGIRAATGEVIGLLHSDDFLFDAHVLSDLADCFAFHPWKVRCGWLPLHPTVYVRREVMERTGLYDERYQIAADTDFLLRCLLDASWRVEYLDRYIVRMRMGGLSTDQARRKQMWREDVAIYRAYGFPGVLLKLLKMGWKVPQFLVKQS